MPPLAHSPARPPARGRTHPRADPQKQTNPVLRSPALGPDEVQDLYELLEGGPHSPPSGAGWDCSSSTAMVATGRAATSRAATSRRGDRCHISHNFLRSRAKRWFISPMPDDASPRPKRQRGLCRLAAGGADRLSVAMGGEAGSGAGVLADAAAVRGGAQGGVYITAGDASDGDMADGDDCYRGHSLVSSREASRDYLDADTAVGPVIATRDVPAAQRDFLDVSGWFDWLDSTGALDAPGKQGGGVLCNAAPQLNLAGRLTPPGWVHVPACWPYEDMAAEPHPAQKARQTAVVLLQLGMCKMFFQGATQDAKDVRSAFLHEQAAIIERECGPGITGAVGAAGLVYENENYRPLMGMSLAEKNKLPPRERHHCAPAWAAESLTQQLPNLFFQQRVLVADVPYVPFNKDWAPIRMRCYMILVEAPNGNRFIFLHGAPYMSVDSILEQRRARSRSCTRRVVA